jgi:hypothetical protein
MILNQLQHYITISIRINHQQWGHNQQHDDVTNYQ